MKLQLFVWQNPTGYQTAYEPAFIIDATLIRNGSHSAPMVAATREAYVAAFNSAANDNWLTLNGMRIRATAVGAAGIAVLALTDATNPNLAYYPGSTLTDGLAADASFIVADANYPGAGAISYVGALNLSVAIARASRITAK